MWCLAHRSPPPPGQWNEARPVATGGQSGQRSSGQFLEEMSAAPRRGCPLDRRSEAEPDLTQGAGPRSWNAPEGVGLNSCCLGGSQALPFWLSAGSGMLATVEGGDTHCSMTCSMRLSWIGGCPEFRGTSVAAR